MDHLDEHLASASVNQKYDPAIRAAVAIGKRTLNRYYDRTDHSELYRIAMSKSILCLHSSGKRWSFSLSITPPPQASLLPACWMGSWLDQDSKKYSSRWVWPHLPFPRWHFPGCRATRLKWTSISKEYIRQPASIPNGSVRHTRWTCMLPVHRAWRREERRCPQMVVWTSTYLSKSISNSSRLSYYSM
jgi:hypothetical protein